MIFSLTRSPPSVKQDRIHHPSVSSTYRATYSGENMAPSRSTPRMMQMTRAAFQAVVSLNEPATDPKSHTLVMISYTLSSPVMSPANSDGRPRCLDPSPRPVMASVPGTAGARQLTHASPQTLHQCAYHQ